MPATDALAFNIAENLSRLNSPGLRPTCVSCRYCSYSSCQQLKRRRNQLLWGRTKIHHWHHKSNPVKVAEPSCARPVQNLDEQGHWPLGAAEGDQVLASVQPECHSIIMGRGSSCGKTDSNSDCGGGSKYNSISCYTENESRLNDKGADNGDARTLGRCRSAVKPNKTASDTCNFSNNIQASICSDQVTKVDVPAALPGPPTNTKFIRAATVLREKTSGRINELGGTATAAKASPIEIIGQVLSPNPFVLVLAFIICLSMF